jgi:hypothetical protein
VRRVNLGAKKQKRDALAGAAFLGKHCPMWRTV